MERIHLNRLAIGVTMLTVFTAIPVAAIESRPSPEQIQAALDAGKAAAKEGRAPDSFYVRFGASDELHPGGFLITKLGALSVMATHMALRGLQPTEADVAQVLETKTMLVSTVIFGDVPTFAQESYMVFDQAGRTVKPVTVRFDGQANRSAAWPERPRFKAKVIASFNYSDFDPQAKTTITVFPASGGAESFVLDFAGIQ
jgi:hypothetical protein